MSKKYRIFRLSNKACFVCGVALSPLRIGHGTLEKPGTKVDNVWVCLEGTCRERYEREFDQLSD